MTPSRLRECLTLLSWTQRGLAAILGIDERRIRRMAAGDVDIPDDVATWLEKLARFHADNPAPRSPGTPELQGNTPSSENPKAVDSD